VSTLLSRFNLDEALSQPASPLAERRMIHAADLRELA